MASRPLRLWAKHAWSCFFAPWNAAATIFIPPQGRFDPRQTLAEAAVVPSPDPIRLAVPKAYVVLKPGLSPSSSAAHALFRFSRQRLPPYARLRRLEFAELPKTISGKIRRVELRAQEQQKHAAHVRGEHEYWEDDFPDLE